ncbi:MAG: hypothetical protein JSU63_02540 [Phycisphaerales bacterium]|nr:MAG: hypothetical protein JSU63_02540 [Phycisphaerales bacterium]
MDLLRIRSLPFFCRRNYYYEIRQLLLWCVFVGLVEGQFASVVVSKTFHGSTLLIAVASATPFAAHIFSLFWGMLCIGRPKIRLAMFFSTGSVLCAGVVGIIPISPRGAIWFICQMAAAQILLTGTITVRSAFWKSNYPRSVRGQVAARLQLVRFMVSVVTVLIASAICDRDPTAYRFVFPGAALFGILGITFLPRIHIRGERSELRPPGGRPQTDDLGSGMVEPFSITALLSPGHVFGQMYRVLKEDHRFAQYCAAQLLTGISNLMTISILVAVITRELDTGDAWGFWVSTGLIVALPRLVMLASLNRWGRLFDRIGVVRFRVVNVIFWTTTLIFGLAATLLTINLDSVGPRYLPLAVFLFAIRGVLYGLGIGGGALAWNLGHLHFAPPEKAEIYMGIHVSLTGMRGLIAPLLGMWLWNTIGWPTWLIAIACALCSLLVFAAMARRERLEGVSERPGDSVA